MGDYMGIVVANAKKRKKLSLTKEEALVGACGWFEEDPKNPIAASSFIKKYALRRGKNDFIESTPDQMHDRMALALAEVEEDKNKWFKIFREQLDGFRKVVPQGSPMASLGNPYQTMTLSNCYVLPIEADTLEAIFKTLYEMGKLQAYRGGVGIDVTPLRPEGAKVSNAAQESTGAWSWCSLFSMVTRMIGQQGREGALMLSIDVKHPDVMNFIRMKSDLGAVTGANVSVRLSDEFMRAVKNDETFDLTFEFNNDEYAPIINTIKARDLWDQIIHYAATTGEPGLLMWDNIIRRSPADAYADVGFRTISTNPCAEIPLCAYDSCRLTSLNLTGFVRNPFTPAAEFAWDEFDESVAVGVRMLDNMVDLDTNNPFDDQTKAALNGRRLGLGTHGLADMLIMLGYKYDSDEAIAFVDKVFEALKVNAYNASIELAKERGPFPVWDWNKEKDNEFIRDLPDWLKEKMAVYGRRNIALLTCAPTGTVSLVSRTSSGIEPIFQLDYNRRVKINNDSDEIPDSIDEETGDKWKHYRVVHPMAERYMKATGCTLEELKAEDIWVTASSIDWEKRVKIQGVITNHLDHSASSTINLPRDTSPEVVGNIYMKAWELGLKGITVYVEGSRGGVLVSDDMKNAGKRPKILDAVAHTVGSNGSTYTVFIGFHNDTPYEVFCVHKNIANITDGVEGKIIKVARGKYTFVAGEPDEDGEYPLVINKINKYEGTEVSAFTRLLSTALRYGSPPEKISEQLAKAKGTITSTAKAINRVLAKYVKAVTGLRCTECGSVDSMIYEEACFKCKDCDYSRCG